MQRITEGRALPDRSPRSVRRKGPSISARSDGTAPSAGLATLAPAFPCTLPTIDGVPTCYSHDLHAELLYELCAALVREGLGGPETWLKCEGSAVLFAQRSIMEAIGEERWNLLQRNVEYHLSISDVAERDGEDVPLGNGRLAVTVECGGSGFLKIGPAIEALEQEAAGLGAAFYWTLT